jgi:hypothetical protein
MPHYLLTHRYAWGTTEEFGLHTLTVFSNNDNQAEVANTARDAFVETTTGSILGQWPAVVRYNRLSAARILSLTTGALQAASHAAMNVAGLAAQASPPQLSIVVSMQGGARPNGTPVRGRFYLPPAAVYNNSSVPETAGRVGSGTITAVGAWVQNYFTELASRGLEPVVWSRTLGSAGSVNNVRVGDVADTVRRRRNQLAENYTAVVYPVPPAPGP